MLSPALFWPRSTFLVWLGWHGGRFSALSRRERLCRSLQFLNLQLQHLKPRWWSRRGGGGGIGAYFIEVVRRSNCAGLGVTVHSTVILRLSSCCRAGDTTFDPMLQNVVHVVGPRVHSEKKKRQEQAARYCRLWKTPTQLQQCRRIGKVMNSSVLSSCRITAFGGSLARHPTRPRRQLASHGMLGVL